MAKNTRKSSFGKWVSSINMKKLYELVEESKQDSYTKLAKRVGIITATIGVLSLL